MANNSHSKARRIFVDDPKEPPVDDLSVPPQVNDKEEVHLGDVLAWSDYRDSDSYIVADDRKLIRNPDNAAAAYLSIPYEISKHFKDAVGHYSDMDVNDIDLRNDDKFVVENFGSLPPDWKYNLNLVENILGVTFPTNGKFHEFVPGHDTSETIRKWYDGSQKAQARFIVSYEFRGNTLDRYKAAHSSGGGGSGDEYSWVGASPQLPATWSRESLGGSGGSDHVGGKHRYEGPKDEEEQARAAVRKFYEGFEGNYNFEE